MYTMQAIASSIFYTMIFPHNGKIVTIDQLTHHEPNQSRYIDNILPLIHASSNISPILEVGPGIFHNLSLMGSYQGTPPSPPTTRRTQFYVITSKGVKIIDEPPLGELSSHTSTHTSTPPAPLEEHPL
jgi:hypothetical protein